MLKKITRALHHFSHLFFPHNCLGCGSDLLEPETCLCLKCFSLLPVTGFIATAENPVEKIFYGRANIAQAGSAFFFTQNSLVQNLVFALKYKGNTLAGLNLGQWLGAQMAHAGRFNDVDVIIPLPLNPRKEKQRGYNQAAVIAQGMQQSWPKPIVPNAVRRKLFTETQTHKGRIQRWQSMQNVFEVHRPQLIEYKHILLLDDVITTGATLEACCNALQTVPGVKISIASAAYTLQ